MSKHPDTTAYMRRRGARVSRSGRTWARIRECSPYLVCAVIGAEDPLFFRHHGIWWTELRRKIVLARRHHQPVRGVSTITQQLARNLYLYPDRSLWRKAKEAVLARRLEALLTKERILELYVNVVELGVDIWGVDAAAREYFGVTAADLDPFQAVFLASLLPGPRVPLAGANLDRAVRSQRWLVFRLYGSGTISMEEERVALERVAQLERGLRIGTSLRDVLGEIASSPFQYTRLNGYQRPTASDLLANECGWERLLAYRQLFTRDYPPVWINARPSWWTGTWEQYPLSG